MWHCIKWHDMVRSCMVYTEHAETAAVSHGTSHVATIKHCKYPTLEDIKNVLQKASHSFRITYDTAQWVCLRAEKQLICSSLPLACCISHAYLFLKHLQTSLGFSRVMLQLSWASEASSAFNIGAGQTRLQTFLLLLQTSQLLVLVILLSHQPAHLQIITTTGIVNSL